MADEEEERRRKRGEEDNDEGGGEEDHGGPAHHPSAPPDELFDISTTVDPSYIISLIRKLLPRNSENGKSYQRGSEGVDKSALPQPGNGAVDTSSSLPESMDVLVEHNESASSEEDGESPGQRHEKPVRSATEEAWEECGCILWDLAASRTHAELMVQNLILEVLHANLMVSESGRVTEICLGIVGNLACHEVPLKRIQSTAGLINIIIEQLFLDDTQCLSEVCRILTSGLYGTGCTFWAELLQSDRTLGRLLWITENTLNPQLIEKSVGLLLAILEGQPEVGCLLIPPLINLGLSNLLISLFSFEMGKLTREKMPERYPVLDIILRAIEALSVLDGHSQQICSNKELFQLVCDLVKLQDKAEVAASCVTAGILIANILSEVPDLIPEISQDFSFLEGIFNILPFASDDLEARRALWKIIARLLVRVDESEISMLCLHQYLLVLLSKSDIIEDDLLDLQLDESSDEREKSLASRTKSSARIIAIKKMVCMLNKWNVNKDRIQDESMNGECSVTDADVERLLDCCHRYIELYAGS